jgi:hypothetical protein
MKEARIDWHQGFLSALKLEFQPYEDALEILSEVNLNAKPLRIDAVIKKKPDVIIPKAIAQIFRRINILEYKSPEDYLSVEGLYKCLGYSYLYGALEQQPLREISLSIVVSRYPREALSHIREVLGWGIQEGGRGIHRIRGGEPLAIQILETRKLHEAEDFWLKDLRHNLEQENLDRILRESKNYRVEYMRAYMDIIVRANAELLEQLMREECMGRKTIEEVLVKTGLAAEFEARGEIRGKAQGRAEGKAQGRVEGKVQGRVEGKASSMKQTLELLRSGTSVEELMRIYEEQLNALSE